MPIEGMLKRTRKTWVSREDGVIAFQSRLTEGGTSTATTHELRVEPRGGMVADTFVRRLGNYVRSNEFEEISRNEWADVDGRPIGLPTLAMRFYQAFTL
jgi:hypothetical protein